MEYDYGFEYAFPDVMEGVAEGAFVGAAGVVAAILAILLLLLMAYSVVAYVLHSVGMYRIAKRRGIHHAWLAWIPVGSSWLLGSISDHYQYVAKQKTTKRRTVLLILELVMYVAAIAVLGLCVAVILSLDADAMAGGIGAAAGMTLVSLAFDGLTIAALIFCYIAYYDLFRSCKPKYDVLFLVLGIFFPVTLPFFVFACSGSDQGMPPRRPVQQDPVQIPGAPEEVTPEPVEEEVPVVETEIVTDTE